MKFILLFMSMAIIVVKLWSIKETRTKPYYQRRMTYIESMGKMTEQIGAEGTKTIMGCVTTFITGLYVIFYLSAAVYVGQIVFAAVSFGLVMLSFHSLSKGFKMIRDPELYNNDKDYLYIVTDLIYVAYLFSILAARW